MDGRSQRERGGARTRGKKEADCSDLCVDEHKDERMWMWMIITRILDSVMIFMLNEMVVDDEVMERL